MATGPDAVRVHEVKADHGALDIFGLGPAPHTCRDELGGEVPVWRCSTCGAGTTSRSSKEESTLRPANGYATGAQTRAAR